MSASGEAAAAPGSPAVEGRAPDFFIVGHFKCGTTALYEMLRQHPQLFLPALKELWFLSPELRSRFRSGHKRPETIEEYLAVFADAGPDQLAGDASPSYLMSEGAARRIAELQPDARIIAILREPAAFLRSFHLQCVQNHVEPETDFARALALEPERREGRQIPPDCPRPHELLYSDHIRYAEQIRRFHEVFPPEQVLVLIYEEFRADNAATLRRVLRFLGVDEQAPISELEANPSVAVRSGRLHAFVRELYMGRRGLGALLKPLIKAVTTRRIRRRALRLVRWRVVYGRPRTPEEQLMVELKRRFRGEVAAVSEHLGRDLTRLWGYDELD